MHSEKVGAFRANRTKKVGALRANITQREGGGGLYRGTYPYRTALIWEYPSGGIWPILFLKIFLLFLNDLCFCFYLRPRQPQRSCRDGAFILRD